MHPLKEWIQSHGMTQASFAVEVGVHESAVSHWINGKQAPLRPMAVRIAEMTGGAVPVECWPPPGPTAHPADPAARRRAFAALDAIPRDAPDSTPVTLDAGALRHLLRQKRYPG